MDYLITPFQNAFIKGRNIFDNILIAHEIFDMLGKMKGRKGCFGALKIDMSFKGCFGALKIDIYCSLFFLLLQIHIIFCYLPSDFYKLLQNMSLLLSLNSLMGSIDLNF